jgi:hypothetical protein
MNMEELNKQAQTPDETAQTLSNLAARLEEMDKAEGFFGEVVTDEDLMKVAGGAPILVTLSEMLPRCPYCNRIFDPKNPPTECLDGSPRVECYFFQTGR